MSKKTKIFPSSDRRKTPAAKKSKEPFSKPGNRSEELVLDLQRSIGNRSVGELIDSGTLRAKLDIGFPGDIYEEEADRMAERVTTMNETGKKPNITPEIESDIHSLKGGSRSLPDSTRNYFEPRFGVDFSQVRLHTDSRAANVSRAINARAFTIGNDIVFAAGRYSPETSEGKRLLAHELTHVAQQKAPGASGKNTIQREPDEWIIDEGEFFELPESAENRATELRELYGDVEVFTRKKDGYYQCQYKETPPKKEDTESTSAPETLELIAEDIGGYTAAELNDALYTVFGEISAELHETLSEEALAVASTIFNRKAAIDNSRKKHSEAVAVLEEKKAARTEREAEYDDLAKHPSKHKKKMTEEEYNAAVDNALAAYNSATKEMGAAQTAAIAASDEKIAAEFYVQEKHREENTITLTMLVDFSDQYKGYAVGKEYYGNYSTTMNETDKVRNAERWETSKEAVKKLAKTPSETLDYVEFRSNKGGKRELQAGETRIGGNDFWP